MGKAERRGFIAPPPGHFIHTFGYRRLVSQITAVIIIETRTFGMSTPSFATARVGGFMEKIFEYALFMESKSWGFLSNTMTWTASSRLDPPDLKIDSQFRMALSVCSSIVLASTFFVAGSNATIPER